MRKYIAELHTKPLAHKKRFALLAAGSVTLVIFSFWSAIRFDEPTVVVQEEVGNLAAVSEAVTPFENLFGGIKDSWNAIVNPDGR